MLIMLSSINISEQDSNKEKKIETETETETETGTGKKEDTNDTKTLLTSFSSSILTPTPTLSPSSSSVSSQTTTIKITKYEDIKSTRQLFSEMLSLNSVDNEEASEIYFHVFMGAYLKNILIVDGISGKDLRLSLTFIQTSRTGKGRLNKAFKKICDYCNISCTIITEYSVAGIIGTINEQAVQYNRKYKALGLSKENPQITIRDKKDKEKNVYWQDPIIIGDAGNYDIIIFDELKILLEPKKENQEIMLCLQPLLDNPPYIRKKLRTESAIEYSNPLSIIGTTFPFSINKILSTQGYLQRTFVYIRILNLKEIEEMRIKQQELLNINNLRLFKQKLQLFKTKLEKIRKEKKVLFVDDTAKNELIRLNKNLLNTIDQLKGANRETLLSFTNTIEETALKIAGQYTVMFGNNTIRGNDVRRSYKIIKKFIDSLVEKIDVKEDKEKEYEIRNIISMFKQEMSSLQKSFLSFTEFRQLLNRRLGKGLLKCGSMIKDLVEAGYFKQERGDKNTYLIRIKE